MTMSLSSTYVEPGIYIKIENVPAPNPQGGNFIPIFVGLGRKEYDITASLVRSSADTKDLISDVYTVIDILSVTSTSGKVYTKNVDFVLEKVSSAYYVQWDNPVYLETIAEPFDIDSKTLKLNVDGAIETITFTAGAIPAAYTAAEVVALINGTGTFVTTTPASVNATKVKITGNTKVYIEGGSALDDLGFTVGQAIESARPEDDSNYIVTYKRLKASSEYKPYLFSRMEDVYAEHGAYATPNLLISSTVVSANSNSLTGNPSIDDLSVVSIGDYIKITAGTGKGQIRVVAAVDSTLAKVTLGDTWTEVPDGSSTYAIYDGPFSEISIGATIAQAHGTVLFMTSQSQDDIVDDNNLRKAITDTKEPVNGYQGWDLVYMKGVDKDDSIVSFIKQYLADMNNPLTKQERKAILGVKAQISNFSDVTALTSGIANSRIGVIANPYCTITGIGNLDGAYMAAAIAGIECNPNYDPGEPISGKLLLFDYIDDPYLRSEKRLLGQYGAIVIEKQGTDNKIVHYLSTKTDDIIDSELKVIKQIDDLKKTLRGTLQNALINIRIVGAGKNIISMADSFLKLILSEKVNIGSISGYKDISIAFNPAEPRELQIKFLFRPTLDLNWISITFGATISA